MYSSNNNFNKTSRVNVFCSSGCTRANRPLKLVTPGGCPDDYVAVATLPDNWEPRHSGPILANYLKQREQDHQTVLDDISNSAAAVNDDINKRVRELSENLLILVQQNQRDIDCLLDKNEEGEKPLAEASREIALKMVRKMLSQRDTYTADFKRNALSLERERADKLRILLRGQFQRLVAVGHRTPKYLIHDFDERIYNVNQQLLSNSKAYTDLEADLRHFSDECLRRARSSLNQLCLGVEITVRGRSALIWNKDQKASRQRTQNMSILSSDPPINILQQVGELDAIISLLVEAYRNAVMKIFTGFSNKLTELEKDLGHYELREINLETPKIEILDLDGLLERQFKHLTNTLNQCDKTFFEMTGAELVTMQESVSSLGECLRETCSILKHAGHLWDAHILRSALAQKLTITAVEDLLTNHDSIELANEVSFNIALEQLRCSPDADKLQQQFEAILILLDKTAEMYLQHSEAEQRRLEEYMNVPAAMANTLLAEFNVFLEQYPRPPLQVLNSATSLQESEAARRSQNPSSTSQQLALPLPRAILQTELQEAALMNWRNGFLESFKSNVSVLPEELKNQAQKWIEERSAALNMRYSLKMVSHAIRLERVNAARETRLAEVRYHDLRLESHLGAITELLERLPEQASQFAGLDDPILYPFCKGVDQLKANIDDTVSHEPLDPEVKSMKMKSYAPRLAKHRLLFEESLETAIEDYKKLLANRIHEVRISNVRYISQIKLFSEGGHYAPPEALKTCTALGKAADSIELCLNKSIDVLNHRRSQLLSLADQKIAPLQRVVCESVKTTGKGSGRSASKLTDKKKKK